MSQPSYQSMGLSVPVIDLIDPERWRKNYAWGLLRGQRLTGAIPAGFTASQVASGAAAGAQEALDQLPNDVIGYHLRVALSMLQMKLGVPMATTRWKADPVDPGLVLGQHYDAVAPRLPYTLGENEQWYRIDLPTGTLSIQRVRAYFYEQLVWEIDGDDPSMLQLQWGRQGISHIIPVQLQSLAIEASSGNYGIWWTLRHHRSPVPRFWAVDYTTGPTTQEGRPGEVELVLGHWVSMVAAMAIFGMDSALNTFGVQSTSVSFDGLSRSISLPPNIYQSLLDQFKALMELIDWEALRSSKRGIRLKMYSY